MISRILLGVDDSPGGLAAARVAVDLAAGLGARLRVVNVVEDGRLAETIEAVSGDVRLRERRGDAAAAVLDHVGELARRAGVQVETCRLEGSPARRILAEAQAWDSDLTVIARSQRRRRAGDPYVGGETAQVLEFTEQPVLVIPTPDPGRRRRPVRA
jgi:nucleotide-binding universal stress UspA family protein